MNAVLCPAVRDFLLIEDFVPLAFLWLHIAQRLLLHHTWCLLLFLSSVQIQLDFQFFPPTFIFFPIFVFFCGHGERGWYFLLYFYFCYWTWSLYSFALWMLSYHPGTYHFMTSDMYQNSIQFLSLNLNIINSLKLSLVPLPTLTMSLTHLHSHVYTHHGTSLPLCLYLLVCWKYYKGRVNFLLNNEFNPVSSIVS